MPGPRTYHTAKSKLLKNDNWIEENVDDGVLFSFCFFCFVVPAQREAIINNNNKLYIIKKIASNNNNNEGKRRRESTLDFFFFFFYIANI